MTDTIEDSISAIFRLWKEKDFRSALQLTEDCIRVAPENSELHEYRALFMIAILHTDPEVSFGLADIESALLKSVELDPDNYDAISELAQFYFLRTNDKKSAQHFANQYISHIAPLVRQMEEIQTNADVPAIHSLFEFENQVGSSQDFGEFIEMSEKLMKELGT